MTPALKALCELREGFEAEATYIHQRSKSQGHILMSELQAILAAIADLTSGKWAVVPVEPTEEMIEQARHTIPGAIGMEICDADIEDIYVTMLNAAPTQNPEVKG